jgi:uracil-DNA glycosylase family 4
MKNAISAIIKNQNWGGAPVFYKSAEEMLFLHGWLSKGEMHLSSLSEESIDSLILKCEKCKNIKEKKKGFGTGVNKIALILNRPVMMNRIEMNLYKTESVDLLRNMVKAIGFDLEECYTTNLIKCESDDAFTKPSDMIKNCTAILEKELNYYKPVIAIVMGEILPLQEIIKKSSGISWFNTEHPVSLLKNHDLKRPAWETLKLVKKKYAELKK